MALEQVEVTERTALEGVPAGAGGYELVRGRASFVLDPTLEANARVTDLALAAGTDGRVRFSADLLVLEPLGREGPAPLLYVVANRGRATTLPLALGAALPGLLPPVVGEAATPPALGDGFVLELGYRIVWCGWQDDLRPLPGILGLDPPLASISGAPPPGHAEIRFELDTPQTLLPLVDSRALSPAVAPTAIAPAAEGDAVLFVRPRRGGAFVEVPRARYRFTNSSADEQASGAKTHISLDDGFQPDKIYLLRYLPERCPVHGVGLTVARDLVSALRRDPTAVLGEGAVTVSHAVAFGVSQSGRYLRQFLFEGLNCDEEGGQVFDGVFADIAGARRGDFNARYGQISVNRSEGPGLLPPYPSRQPAGGLLDRQRSIGGLPKVIFVNSAFEYWRRDASAIHTAEDGSADLAEDDDVRCYLIAGASHVVGAPAIPSTIGPANPVSVLDPMPVKRALFLALAEWVEGRALPPDSVVPRVAAGETATREEVLARLAMLPGLKLPDATMLPVTSRSYPGDEEVTGDGVVALDDRVVGLVSAVDEDGNERAGVILPELAAPLFTHLGFNPRASSDGDLFDLIGTSVPLPVDDAARAAAGDPRRSVLARYPDRSDYEEALSKAIAPLVARRLLLARDEAAILEAGLAHYDAAVEPLD